MRILSKRTLRAFWDKHPHAQAPLALWYARVTAANWDSPSDVRKDFGTADFVDDNRVIFNIGGNKYRLVAHVAYGFGQVMIKFVGTHAGLRRHRSGASLMDIRPIHTEADYDWALAELDAYFRQTPEPGSPEGDRFEVLATLVEAYENDRWPMPTCDPVDILAYAISDMGRTQAQLAELLGSRSHASEVLSRKRPLSLEMIRRISEAWDLPPALLIARYDLIEAA